MNKLEELEIFRNITTNYLWDGTKESMAGCGSTKAGAQDIAIELKTFIDNHDVTSILDIPCGDCNWQYLFLNDNIKYIGCDLIFECVEMGRKKLKKQDVKGDLYAKNIHEDELFDSDLVLVRDGLVHLSDELVKKSLDNILSNNNKYIAITNFTKGWVNSDIPIGHWQPRNLMEAPWDLPKPYCTLVEFENDKFCKTIAIWKKQQLISIM